MATAFASPPHVASLLSSSSSTTSTLHSNSSSLYLPTRTRSSRTRTRSLIQTKKFIIFKDPPFLVSPKSSSKRLGSIPAAAEDVVPSDAAAVDAAQQMVSNSDDGVSTVISALLFVAFIGLSLLTIGVIYLGVTDFLQKREKDKFEKEEAANKSGKKKKKKKTARARAGPRGFGQKIDEEEEDDD